MNTEDRHRIIRGQVFCDGRWVPIENKASLERQRRKKIEAGYVFFQGEWIPIDEKLARTAPSKLPGEHKPQSIVVNINDNRTTYNVDNRTVHEHEHRHVHIDKRNLEAYLGQTLPDAGASGRSIDGKVKKTPEVPAPKSRAELADERKIKGLLNPPEA